MKRRRALKNLGLSFSAGIALPVLPGLLGSCKEADPGPEIRYDGIVAVIGAGAAGLYAADFLKSKGVNIKIFEASDRVGGRIRSMRLSNDSPVKTDFPIELGAERILGTNSLWAEIIDQLNVPVIDLSSTATDNYILDKIFREGASVQSDADFAAAKNFLDNLSAYAGDNVSVLQAIQSAGLNPRMYAILNSWIGNKHGTSNSHLSAKGLAEALTLLSRNKMERLLRSNPMQDVLASRFNAVIPSVEFSTAIKTIDYSSSKIKLLCEKIHADGSTENISMEADKVIVTVPVSILKTAGINFIPSLPAPKTISISHLDMDPCIRMVLDFKQNFWGEHSGFLYGGDEFPEYFNTGVARSQFNKTLSITISGEQAQKISNLGVDGAIQSVLKELDIVFAGKASLNIRKDDAGKIANEYFDWTKQPYIKGGISYLKPGGTISDRTELAEPINRSLFFAGEATDNTGESGTVNGALLSAKRAAQEVVEAILNP